MAKKKKEEQFDLFSDSVKSKIAEALDSLSERSKTASKFYSGSVQVLDMLKLPNLYLQWFFGCMGLIVGRIVEILGPESVGKSSFLYWIFGVAMSQNSPCLYVEVERKYTKERIRHILCSTVKRAEEMLSNLSINQPSNVVDMAEGIEKWVIKMREEVKVPMHIPLVVGIDTFSAIQTAYESSDKRSVGDTKMGDHAKFAAAWMRKWPSYAEQHRVILVILSQQKDKLKPGMAGGAPQLSEDVSERFNKTKLGGRAFNFHSTHQILLLRKNFIKGKDLINIGDRCMMEVLKSGIGRPRRQLFFDLLWLHPPAKSDDIQTCPISFEETTAEWLATSRIFGIHPAGSKLYSSKELKLKEVTADKLLLELYLRPDLIDQAGKSLRIFGYDSDEVPPCVAVQGGQVAVEDTVEGGEAENPVPAGESDV